MKAFKRIFCIILSLILTSGTAITAFALPPAPTDEDGNPLPYSPLQTIGITPSKGTGKYEDYFVEYLQSQYENETFEYYYDEIFEQYDPIGNPSTPDYVLVECYKDYVSFEGEYSVNFDKYEIKRYYGYYPYKLGYFVFVPEEEKIYTLEEAVEAEIPGVYNAIEEIDYDPYYDIQCYCGLQVLENPGGGPSETINTIYLGSEKGAEIYESDPSWGDASDEPVSRIIGDWKITSSKTHYPYDLGIYVYCNSKVYTLEEAMEKGLVTDISCINNSQHTTAAMSKYDQYDPDDKYDYEQVIIPLVEEKYLYDDTTEITSYSEIYKHYETDGGSTPDYVLINLYTNLYYSMPVADILGDKLLCDYSGNIPFTYGYGVYIPETGEIYGLTYALTLDIAGIENTLEHIGYDALMGDTDGDRKLTIKDATYLQKCLAGLESFDESDDITSYFTESKTQVYISDYNRDGVRNIRDATAIQKKLAKIEF